MIKLGTNCLNLNKKGNCGFKREMNEEILINLVEQVIEKLKLEMVEFEI